MKLAQNKTLDQIPDDLIKKVRESVLNTCESIIGEELEQIGDGKNIGPLDGIIGNITVFNAEHTISLMLAMPKDTALFFSEVFIGVVLPFESDDMGDLIGEISNILAGDVAANIEKIGFRGQSSLPTTTRGSDLTLFLPNKSPIKKMRFTSKNTEFILTVVLSESK